MYWKATSNETAFGKHAETFSPLNDFFQRNYSTSLNKISIYFLMMLLLCFTAVATAQPETLITAVEDAAETAAGVAAELAEGAEEVLEESTESDGSAYAAFMFSSDSVPFTINNLWILIATVLVAAMHLGFAVLESGLCQAKNTTNILFKNTFILTMGLVTYALIGFNTMYPGTFNNYISIGGPIPSLFASNADQLSNLTSTYNVGYTYWSDFIFQAMFAATAATIVSGAVAERIKLVSFMIFVTLLVAIAYPVAGSWHWGGGWLKQRGFYDFAGSSVVHAFGGAAALACVLILGARTGKYVNGKTFAIPPHSMPLATIGVFILFLGWFGFNGGSVLSADPALVSYVFVTTALAAAAGCLSSIFVGWIVLKSPDLSMALNGLLAGLVGITAGADTIPVHFAMLVGAIAGALVVGSILLIDKTLKLDDPVGAISVHGVCGVFGTIAVGIFSTNPDHKLNTQLIGTSAYCLFAFIFSAIVFTILKFTLGIRVSEEEEYEGLDIGEHSQEAYINPNWSRNSGVFGKMKG
ncbi:MAG: ammonium transporter [Sumerlaeia bacterium]